MHRVPRNLAGTAAAVQRRDTRCPHLAALPRTEGDGVGDVATVVRPLVGLLIEDGGEGLVCYDPARYLKNDLKERCMRTYNMTAVIWREANVYVSKCPETGLASCGDTPDEALINLKEAVELYLENAKRLGILPEIQETLDASGKFTTSFAASVR